MSTSNKLDPTQYPGKTYTTSTFNLTLIVEPGSMVNWEAWIPANKTAELFDMPYEKLEIEAWYDDTPLINKCSLSTNVIISKVALPDDHEQTDHIIKIKLSGKDDSLTINYSPTEQAVGMAKIKLYIEDLPINYCLEGQEVFYTHANSVGQSWAEYMGENGEQHIELKTPIYTWLLGNHVDIISEIRSSQFYQKD